MGQADDERAREDRKKQYYRALARQKILQNPGLLARRINKVLADDGYVRRIVENRFATAGASSGESWPTLSTKTALQRGKQGYNSFEPILVRSGRLLDAATQGNQLVDDTSITLMFQDGPAPVYIGGGKIRRNKKFSGGKMISSYASAINKGEGNMPKRAFYGRPTPQELIEILAARDALINQVLKRLGNEESISDLV